MEIAWRILSDDSLTIADRLRVCQTVPALRPLCTDDAFWHSVYTKYVVFDSVYDDAEKEARYKEGVWVMATKKSGCSNPAMRVFILKLLYGADAVFQKWPLVLVNKTGDEVSVGQLHDSSYTRYLRLIPYQMRIRESYYIHKNYQTGDALLKTSPSLAEFVRVFAFESPKIVEMGYGLMLESITVANYTQIGAMCWLFNHGFRLGQK